MNQKNISIICIALCLILIGGYILRQNYLLEKAYKTAGIYDYIPAEESKIILEISEKEVFFDSFLANKFLSLLKILKKSQPENTINIQNLYRKKEYYFVNSI